MNGGFLHLDRVVLLLYAAALLGLAFRRWRRRGGGDDVATYLVAGRAISLPAFVANLVATWYGGILGVGEYSYRHGVSNWLVLGVPYYLAALLFAFVVAPRARRSQALTIPEQLRAAYGPGVGFLGAMVVLVMTVPGAYVLMAGKLVSAVFGLPLAVAVVAATLLSGSYLLFGGMRAIVAADRYYFVLMYASFLFMVGFLATRYGGLDWLRAHLPPQQFTWNGGRPVQAVLVWYVIALSTLIEPSFYEACFAAGSARTARTGILISVGFWAVFDFLTTTTGLYARALLPDLPDATRAFPLLAEHVLPPVLRGLFFAGMLATIMSTVDSYLFLSAQTLGHDMLWRACRRTGSSNPWTRLGLPVAGAAAVALALSGFGVVQIWHHLGSIGTPALVVPMLASFDARLRPAPRVAAAGIGLAAATAAVWLVSGGRAERYWLGIEPIFPALGVSLAVWAAGVGAARRRSRPCTTAGDEHRPGRFDG